MALWNISLLSGQSRFCDSIPARLKKLSMLQNGDGCFIEYGGPDLGYHTITLSLLAQLHDKMPDTMLEDMLGAGRAFCNRELDDLGRVPPGSWSRNTQFVYPYSFAAGDEGPLLSRIVRGQLNSQAMNPLWLDDRYMLPLASDYILTYQRLVAMGSFVDRKTVFRRSDN